MEQQRICREILTDAAEAVGGKEVLAKILGQDINVIDEWLNAKRPIPMKDFFEACLILVERHKEL